MLAYKRIVNSRRMSVKPRAKLAKITTCHSVSVRIFVDFVPVIFSPYSSSTSSTSPSIPEGTCHLRKSDQANLYVQMETKVIHHDCVGSWLRG